ncbi:hypothetical protein KR044_004454, partial [Drosophila immigrans]
MSGVQLNGSALKAKEITHDAATVEPSTTTTTAATTIITTPTATAAAAVTTTTIAKKTLTSSAALSLFDQLKNGVNLNSLTVSGATETKATAAALPPPDAPLPNIDLKPPPKPPKASTASRTFSTPILLPPTSSIGIVHGIKRCRDNGNGNSSGIGATPATLSHRTSPAAKLSINTLRSQLYQGARKTTVTTKTSTTTRTTATTVTTTTARGERVRASASANGNSTKKRCLDRYDSSESSDR